MIDLVYDAASGTYYGPDSAAQEDQLENFFGLSRLSDELEQDERLRAILADTITAIFDTGLLHSHPMLQDRIVGDKDFTGEGSEDLHGHGTVVALQTSGVRFSKILNVKVVSKSGYGSARSLVDAMEYVRQFKGSKPDLTIVANLSMGIFSRRWIFFRCRGKCRICRAAQRLSKAGVRVVAAAGNSPNKTACPATLGVVRDTYVFAVSAPDLPSSGIGKIGASGAAPTWRVVHHL